MVRAIWGLLPESGASKSPAIHAVELIAVLILI
jgi:hypothetical protein